MIFKTQIKKENYFLSQPYQPFFILGIVNVFVMMLIFALSYKGVWLVLFIIWGWKYGKIVIFENKI